VSSAQSTADHCAHPECAGPRLQGRHCLEHVTEREFDAALTRLRGGELLNASSTTISSERLKALLDALKNDDDQSILSAADFRGATFTGYAVFSEVTFSGVADFDEATFNGYAPFRGATFRGDARFRDVTFSSDARFGGATFSGYAGFDGATFNGAADFDYLTFSSGAGFRRATFSCDARFDRATFNGHTVFHGTTFNGNPRFNGVTFNSYADFGGATFSDHAPFRGATFNGEASFGGATFNGYADFDEATFGGGAGFGRAAFGGDANFVGTTFSGGAGFEWVTFGGDAGFSGATFNDSAGFDGATFNDNAGFEGSTFNDNGSFSGATFSGRTGFDGTTFNRVASFRGATFHRTRQLGPLIVRERLTLDNCVFAERASIETAATVVSARAVTFSAGVHLRMRGAEIALDDADFARVSTLSGAVAGRPESDLPPRGAAEGWPVELEPRPRLLTLRGAHVAALSLSHMDLRPCRFFGAHGLESLTIEPSCHWPHTPPVRRYIHRETIAEEHHFRGSGWDDPATQAPPWLQDRDGNQPLQPQQIAVLYRALRKAREDDKDEAGAADLYYGEMEMRRRSSSVATARGRTRARGDRAILHAYWLLSGYGLRPTRALASLAVTLLICAALLRWFGFHEELGYGRSLLFAIESSLSLLRPPETGLSASGEVIQITLRLLGPLLFGLALLAVRARVKR
jgi:hypothetical protein